MMYFAYFIGGVVAVKLLWVALAFFINGERDDGGPVSGWGTPGDRDN